MTLLSPSPLSLPLLHFSLLFMTLVCTRGLITLLPSVGERLSYSWIKTRWSAYVLISAGGLLALSLYSLPWTSTYFPLYVFRKAPCKCEEGTGRMNALGVARSFPAFKVLLLFAHLLHLHPLSPIPLISKATTHGCGSVCDYTSTHPF